MVESQTDLSSQGHLTVLRREAVEALAIRQDGVYIDATFGRGGHSVEILKRLSANGKLLVIDKDPQAIDYARAQHGHDARVVIRQGSFREISPAMQAAGVAEVDGILLDLGVSSPQLDEAARGFSFMREGDLDMRMDPGTGMSAREWLATADEKEIADVIFEYGEERFSRRIARAIIKKRAETPIRTTSQLAEIITASIPRELQRKEPGKHPATRTFQAIRIFINHELDDLQACLEQSLDSLAAKGRLVVISFHSLEDRMVKRFMSAHSRPPRVPRGLPMRQDQFQTPKLKLIGKPVRPGNDEVALNKRARSAIMRVAEKQREVTS